MPKNQNRKYSVCESFESNILLVYGTTDSLKLPEWKKIAVTYRTVGMNLHVRLIPKNCLLCYDYDMYTCNPPLTCF